MFVIVFLLVFAVVTVIRQAIYVKNSELYNFDLSDFSISEISDEQIIEIYRYSRGVGDNSWAKGERSGLSSYYEYEDRNNIHKNYSVITGINTISATLAEDCKLTLKITPVLRSGNAQIVIIEDDVIIERFDCGEEIIFEKAYVGEHRVFAKLLCEEAELEITVTREME